MNLGGGFSQTRLNGAAHFTACSLEFRDGLAQVAGAGGRLLYPFGSMCDPPGAEPARRAFERMRRRGRVAWLGARNPFQHLRDLAGKNLQNLSLEALIAESHPSEMTLVKNAVRRYRAKISRPLWLGHDTLSPPTFFVFDLACRDHAISVPKVG
jgi:hypothetical protein